MPAITSQDFYPLLVIYTQLDKTEPLTWFIVVDHFKQFLITHALITRLECFRTECALYVKTTPLGYVCLLFPRTHVYARCQEAKGMACHSWPKSLCRNRIYGHFIPTSGSKSCNCPILFRSLLSVLFIMSRIYDFFSYFGTFLSKKIA